MSKTWLGAVLEEHLLVAVFLYNLALVKGAGWLGEAYSRQTPGVEHIRPAV